MKASKLHKSMDFMMSVLENMEMLMFGNTSLHFSIIFLSQLLLKEIFSACMEVYRQVLTLLIK